MTHNAGMTYVVRQSAPSRGASYSYYELVRRSTFNDWQLPDVTLARFYSDEEAKIFWAWLQPLVPQ